MAGSTVGTRKGRRRGPSLTTRLLIGLQYGWGCLDTVNDAQQCACEAQQLAEAVEAEVDEIVRQADHLRRGGAE